VQEERDLPRYVISVVARLAGISPARLRSLEKAELIRPARTAGKRRLYSDADLVRIRQIVELTDKGVNLAGVKIILERSQSSENPKKEV
jgi:MerR family transcriptional regulator/heat shock protein HspR